MIDQASQRFADRGVAFRRRRPFDLRRRSPGAPDRLGKRGQADIEHFRGRREELHALPPTIRAARRTACALLGASIIPASRNATSCRSWPCGSPAVPHTNPTNTTLRPALAAFFFAAAIT